jgi:hypothetical protein
MLEPLTNHRRVVVAVLLCLVTAAGAYLRLRSLDAPGLWFDEGITLEQATRPTLGETFTASATHPPLTRLLVRASIAALGHDGPGGWDLAARLPSALLGTLAIPFLFLCCRRLAGGDDVVGLLAAGFWAAGVYYSQEARYYGGLVLFSAWSIHGALLLAEAPRSIRRQAYLFAGLVLGLFNHHLFAVAWLTSGLWVLRALVRDPRRAWPALAPWVFAAAAVAPWLRFAMTHLEPQARPWIPGLAMQVRDVPAGWFTGRVGYYHLQLANWNQWLHLDTALSASLLLAAGLVVHAVRRRGSSGWLAAVAFLGPLLGALLVHDRFEQTRFLHQKYLAFLFPLVALFVAEVLRGGADVLTRLSLWPARAAVDRGPPGPGSVRQELILATAVVALLFVARPLWIGVREAHARQRPGSATYLPREHYREVARWVQARRGPGSLVVVHDPYARRNNTWLLRYYGVTGPLVSVTDWQMAVAGRLPPEVLLALRRAADVLVVVAHASDADLARVERFVRARHPSVRARFGALAAEGFTHGLHLGR